MLVSGVRMTVLSGREEMCGGQEAGGRRHKRYWTFIGFTISYMNVRKYAHSTLLAIYTRQSVYTILRCWKEHQ